MAGGDPIGRARTRHRLSVPTDWQLRTTRAEHHRRGTPGVVAAELSAPAAIGCSCRGGAAVLQSAQRTTSRPCLMSRGHAAAADLQTELTARRPKRCSSSHACQA